MGMVTVNIQPLLTEAGLKPVKFMEETRLAPRTAYTLAHGEGRGITFEVLARLCEFFTDRLGRPIGPGDILVYKHFEQDNPPAN